MTLELSTFVKPTRAEYGLFHKQYLLYDNCHSPAWLALVESKNETEEEIPRCGIVNLFLTME
jgi:hypothetical protein